MVETSAWGLAALDLKMLVKNSQEYVCVYKFMHVDTFHGELLYSNSLRIFLIYLLCGIYYESIVFAGRSERW